jgi:hypothetical protein
MAVLQFASVYVNQGRSACFEMSSTVCRLAAGGPAAEDGDGGHQLRDPGGAGAVDIRHPDQPLRHRRSVSALPVHLAHLSVTITAGWYTGIECGEDAQ